VNVKTAYERIAHVVGPVLDKAGAQLGKLERYLPLWVREAMGRRDWMAPSSVLGLDVDGDRVFAVALDRVGRTILLDQADDFQLPPVAEAETAGVGEPDEVAGEVPGSPAGRIVVELGRRGFRSRELAAVIARERTFQRAFRLPAATGEELEAMAALKAERELPLPPAEACTDYLFVRSDPGTRALFEGAGPETEFGHLAVVSAVSKAVVAEATAPFADAGLRPRSLEVVGQAAFRALAPLWRDSGEVVCLLVVRAGVTELVVGGEHPVFTRSMALGSEELAGDRDGVTRRLAAEVARSLQAFAAEFVGARVGRLLLVSPVPADLDALTRVLGIPVDAPQRVPVADLGIGGTVGELDARYAPALGAAWQELSDQTERVNFVRPRAERRQQARRYHRVKAVATASALGMLAVLIPVLALVIRFGQLRWAEHRLAAFGPQLSELQRIERRLELLRPWTSAKEQPLELLKELTAVATAELYLESATVGKDGRLTLKGLATGPDAVRAMVQSLAEKSTLLSRVSRGSGQTSKDATFGYRFTVTAELHKWAGETRQGRR